MQGAASSHDNPELTAEIHLVACGQGDTTLLRLGADWLAIDCHIPRGAGETAWEEYRALLDALNVRRLRALVITHFDIDHYRGAAKLLRFFTEERDGVAAVCATASLTERSVANVLAREYKRVSERTEFAQLRDALLRYCLPDGPTRLVTLHADHSPLELGGMQGGWYIAPIYPFSKQALQLPGQVTGKKGVDHNALSSALMIGHTEWNYPLLLAGGDVPGNPHWLTAMQYWRSSVAQIGGTAAPNAHGPLWIKIPHHGSFTRGHSDELFKPPHHPDIQPHAFISAAAARPPLPDRRTLEEYLNRGYRVWNTGLLQALGETPVVPGLTGFGVPDNILSLDNRIIAHWPENNPGPPNAMVTVESLDAYGQAKD